MSKQYIKIKEASEMLGVSKLTLRNWDKNGKLKAFRHPMNNYRVYRLEDVENILQQIKEYVKPVDKQEKAPPPPRDDYASKIKIYALKSIHPKN